jgi:hypothetical protein
MSDYKTRQTPEDRKKDDDDRGFFFWLWGRNRGLSSFAEVAIISTVFGIILAIILWAYPMREDVVATPEAPPAAEPVAAAPAEETVQTQNWGSSVIFPIEGRDAAQKRAAFDVAVLPTDLTWAHKSSSAVTQGGAAIAAEETANRVFTPELRDGLNRSSEVIAVGLASQEGQVTEEAERARQRSLTAANWLASAVPPEKAIWTLNLGQFKGSCKAAEGATGTSWQRPLIIVGIREQEEGVDITEAFADAISGKSNLPSRDCYTNFDLSKFR